MVDHLQRDLTSEERRELDSHLCVFKKDYEDHFHSYDFWKWLDFSKYEGVPLEELIQVPYSLLIGEKMVQVYGCRWCMIKVGEEWHYAIKHESLSEPINLSRVNKKKLMRTLSKRWQRRLLRFESWS